MHRYSHHYEKGFTLIISVLLVGAVGLSVALTMLFLSNNSLQTLDALQSSSAAQATANSCAEYALEGIRAHEGVLTTGTLNVGQHTCAYTITDLGGESRTLTSTATVDDITKSTIVTLSGFQDKIDIVSWQEK